MSTQQPSNYPPQSAPKRLQGRGISFYLAWIFGILLFVLGGFFLLTVAAVVALGLGAGPGGASLGQVHEAHFLGSRRAPKKIALIPVHGAIGMGGEGPLSSAGTSLSEMRDYLDAAAEDSAVVGVILHVNSPGGTVTDSDAIHDLIQRFRRRTGKPVSAYFHSLAASGAYYVSMASEHITAQPTGLVGSIGVILGALNYSEAMQKLGLKRITILSRHTPFKDTLSPDRPMRADENAYLTSMVEEMYQGFVDIVDAGRPKLSHAQVLALADGKVYTAKDAKAKGLVDDLGSIEDAFAWMQNRVGTKDLELVLYGPPPTIWSLLGLESQGQRAAGESLKKLSRALQGVADFADPTPRMMYLWTGRS